MPSAAVDHPETFILMAMIRMALADHDLGADEVAEIRRVYRSVTGRDIAASTIGEIARAVEDDSDHPLDWLKKVRGQLGNETRELIITAVYRVLIADDRIAGEELKRLTETADALGMSEIHYKTVLETLEEETSTGHQRRR